MAGCHAPKVENACELGFGEGLSVSIHAATQLGVNWYGADFNPSQVAFAASANTLDAVNDINMTPGQVELIRSVQDLSFRESIRDFCVNQQFRRDYWVRGVRNLVGHEQIAVMRDERVVLVQGKENLPTKVRGALGEAGLLDVIYQPIFEILLDYKPHSIQEIEAYVAVKGVNFGLLNSALGMLLGLGAIQPAASGQDFSRAKTRTQALNKAIARRSLSLGDIGFMASPVTGGGVPASRFQQLFWLSKQSGGKTPDDWAAYAWEVLKAQGQAIIKEGAMLQGDDNLAELKSQAAVWGTQAAPIWGALGI